MYVFDLPLMNRGLLRRGVLGEGQEYEFGLPLGPELRESLCFWCQLLLGAGL